MFRWFPLLVALMVSLSLAEPAPVLVGGDFESADAKGGLEGWYIVPGSDVQRVAEGENHFARLKVATADTSSLIQRELPIPAGWKAASLTARVRYQSVAAGKKSWNDARVQLMFIDDKRRTIGRPAVMNWTGTEKAWQSQSISGAVPAGATKIKIQIGLFDAKSGVLDVDDVVLTAGDAAAPAGTDPATAGTDPATAGASPATAGTGPATAGTGPATAGTDAAAAANQPLPYTALHATFADAKVEGKSVAGWHVVNGEPQVIADKALSYLRLAADAETKTVQVRRFIGLHPDWAKLKLAAKVRYRDIRRGNATWNDARIIVEFFDAAGKRVGPASAMNWGKGSSKGGWVDESADYVIPFGAARVKIEPALLAVTSGTLEIAQLDVTITESRSELAKVELLPDAWKPALTPHWREKTATREKVCLNGVWEFRPIGLADGDPKQVTAGVIANPPFPVDMAEGLGWGYGKVPSTFPGTKESAHEWKMPVGWSTLGWAAIDAVWFRRTVDVPAEWKGRRVLLEVDTPQSQAAVFVGKKLVGRITYPAGEVDLTDAAPAGSKVELTLLVIAKPFSEARVQAMNPNELYLASSELKQKGLCGDVFLRSEPMGARITGVQMRPSVRNKGLGLHLSTGGVSDAGTRVKFTASIGDAVEKEWTSDPLPVGDSADVTVPWLASKLWDIDAPNLYRVKLALVDGGGKVLDEVEHRLGFREMWLDGRDIILNGSPVHWRVTKIGNNLAGRSKQQMAGMFARMRELGFNAAILDYDVYPGSAPSYQPMLEAADEAGVILTFTIPSLLPWKGDAPDEAARRAWEKLTDACIRMVENHPSVLAYATNHNRLGYVGSMSPDKIDGLHDPAGGDAAFVEKRKIAADAEAYIRRMDPTREVYHHSSGNFGAWESSNTYLNWMPLQERADYLAHWGSKGVKPLFLTEWGMPFVASFGRYRGPGVYRPTSDSEPLYIEYAAALTGARAYQLHGVHEQYVDQYETAYAKTGKSSWAILTNPFMRRSTEWNYVEIQTLHALKTFPAMRTWGISALLPWDYKSVGVWTEKTPQKVTLTEPAQAWTTPGLHPDFANGSGYSNEETWFNSPAAETFRLTSLAEAYRKVQADVLPWIAGRPEKFTEVSHVFSPGQTVTKQVIVINDLRRELTAGYDVQVTVGNKTIATKAGQVTIPAGRQQREPFDFTIPADATGSGKISLTLKMPQGDKTDEFSFDVLPPAPAVKPAGVVLWDPKGLTAKSLAAIGVSVPASDGTIPPDAACLLIGREALSVEGPLPDIRPLLARGGRVVVFEQTEAVLSRRLGFRTAVPSTRNVFVRTGHPILSGLNDELLRDWNGEATLMAPRLTGLPALELKYPANDWLGFRNTRVWKAGNWGQVASVVIEKPQTGDFLPLIDGGFDLQYAPLLVARLGGGELLLCQMDLSGRTSEDPAAQRLLANIVRWSGEARPKPTATTAFIGDEATQTFLASLGAHLTPADTPPADGVCVIGPDVTADRLKALLPAIEKSRATFVLLATPAAALAAFGDQVAVTPVKLIADSLDENAPADLTAGIGPAELHLRARTPIAAVAPKAGWRSTAGALAQMQLGSARLVFVQIDPRAFDYKLPAKHYVKLTHNHTRTLLSRVLANAGVTMNSPLLDLWSSPASQAELDLSKLPWQSAVGDNADAWKDAAVPGEIDHPDFKGTFWYRVTFDMPPNLTGELLLTVGRVDDEDWTSLNGQEIGHVGKDTHPATYYKQLRQYRIPPGLLKPKGNELLIKANNIEGPAGILEGPVHIAPPTQRWRTSYYHDTPAASDDPYRYYRW